MKNTTQPKEIVEVFKGGYPSPNIGNLSTANCGAHYKIFGKVYEVMGNEISSHSTVIISKYIQTDTGKVEISVWFNSQIQAHIYGIAYYRHVSDNQSFRYTQKIPKKYDSIKEEIKVVYDKVFKAKA